MGREFFVHGNKGRKPANAIQEDTKIAVIELYSSKYYDASFTHYTELLAAHEGIPCKFLTDRRTVFTYKKKNSPSS